MLFGGRLGHFHIESYLRFSLALLSTHPQQRYKVVKTRIHWYNAYYAMELIRPCKG